MVTVNLLFVQPGDTTCFVEKFNKCIHFQRLAEVVTLQLITPLLAQYRQLLGCFNAFSNDFHTKAMGHTNYGRSNRIGTGCCTQVPDK